MYKLNIELHLISILIDHIELYKYEIFICNIIITE